MLTNKDRKQNKHIPYSYPIAYAMKGSSMTNADLQYMVGKLRDVLDSKGIPVLCEAYGGQWHNHITQTLSGRHLTKMYGRASWSHISKLSKDKCIEELSVHSIVKNVQGNAILKLKCGFINHEEGNLEITQENNGTITLGTCTQKMSQIVSVMQNSHPDLFSNGFRFYKSNPHQNPSLPRRNKRKVQLGLIQGERDILELLVLDECAENDNLDVDDNFLPDLRPGNENLENYLLGTDCPLLTNILTQLKVYNPDKWSNKTNEYMYTHLLTDANELLKMCTVKELNIIATELRCFTGRLWFSANLLKAENVNVIVSAFGSAPLTNIESSHKKDKLYQPDTLLTLASCALKHESYPVEHLQISLGTVIHRQLKEDWYANATCPLSVPIPHEHNSALVKEMEFF